MAMARVCSLDDLWEGEMKEVSVAGRKILEVLCPDVAEAHE